MIIDHQQKTLNVLHIQEYLSAELIKVVIEIILINFKKSNLRVKKKRKKKDLQLMILLVLVLILSYILIVCVCVCVCLCAYLYLFLLIFAYFKTFNLIFFHFLCTCYFFHVFVKISIYIKMVLFIIIFRFVLNWLTISILHLLMLLLSRVIITFISCRQVGRFTLLSYKSTKIYLQYIYRITNNK